MTLAKSHVPRVFSKLGLEPTGSNLAAAFAGSVAPDAGYYPGAEPVLSETSHRQKPEDLCRAMLDGAVSQSAKAFAIGWLSHLLADWRGHRDVVYPVVDPANPNHHFPHQKLEWGIDCMLLTQPMHAWLWRPYFEPGDGPLIWQAALKKVYGLDLPLQKVRHSLDLQLKVMKRLPKFFLLTGNSARTGQTPLYFAGLLMGRPLSRILARGGGTFGLSESVRAILAPTPPGPETWQAWRNLVKRHGDDLLKALSREDSSGFVLE